MFNTVDKLLQPTGGRHLSYSAEVTPRKVLRRYSGSRRFCGVGIRTRACMKRKNLPGNKRHDILSLKTFVTGKGAAVAFRTRFPSCADHGHRWTAMCRLRIQALRHHTNRWLQEGLPTDALQSCVCLSLEDLVRRVQMVTLGVSV